MAPAVQDSRGSAPEVDRQTKYYTWWPGEGGEETGQEVSTSHHVATEEVACAQHRHSNEQDAHH